MGIGISVFLIAVGAVLTFAFDRNIEGIDLDLDAVGIILMIVGFIGLLFTGLIWGDGSYRRGPRDDI